MKADLRVLALEEILIAPVRGRVAAVQQALDDVLPDVFAMAREAMRRTLAMRAVSDAFA